MADKRDKPAALRLGVNIDHVATIRNARGGLHPDPIRAALAAVKAGADGITAHLREDRRHISDGDIERLKRKIALPLNLEMAASDEMLKVALNHRPHACCLVPERRKELTTEGGLDVAGAIGDIEAVVSQLRDAGIRVSLFIDSEPAQIEAAKRLVPMWSNCIRAPIATRRCLAITVRPVVSWSGSPARPNLPRPRV